MLAGQLEIDFVTNMAKLVQDVQQGKGAVVSACNEMQAAAENVKKAFELVAVGFGALKFTEFVGKALESAAAMEELSQRTGMTTESLSQLEYATKVSGLGAESLGQAMKKLQVSMANASAGDQLKIAMFKQLGVTQDDLGQGTQAVMLKMADAYAHAQDGAGKTALSIGLMGKAGDELIPFLNRGAEAIRGLMNEADALGLTITGDFATRAKEFEENLARIQASGQKLAILLAGDFVDGLNKAMQAFISAAKEGSKLQALIAGIQTLLTGDDMHKANVQLVSDTDKLITQQNYLQRLRNAGYTDDTKIVQSTLAQIAATQQSITTTQQYRGQLQGEADAKTAAAEAAKKAREEGVKLEAQSKASLAAAQKEEAEYLNLKKAIDARVAVQAVEIQQGGLATDFDKFAAKLAADLKDAKVALTAAHKAEIQSLLDHAKTTDMDNQVVKSQLAYAQQLAAVRQSQKNTDYAQSKAGIDEINAAWAQQLKTVNDAIKAQQDDAAAEQLVIGLNVSQAQAIELVRIARLRDEQTRMTVDGDGFKALQDQIDAREKLLSLLGDRAAWQQQIDLMRAVADEGKTLWDDLWSGGHNVLQKLGQDIKKFLIDELYELVVKKWVFNIAANITGAGASGAVQGGASALFGGAGSSLGTLGGIGNAIMGGFSGSGAAGFAAAGSSFASTVGGGLATDAMGATVAEGAAAAGIETGAMGAASAALAAIPVVGWIGLAALAAYSIFGGKGGGPKTESGFGDAVPNRGDPSGATNVANTIQSAYSSLAGVLGVTNTTLSNLSVFYAQDPKGTAQTQLQVVGGAYARSDMYGGQFENVGRTDADFQNAVALASAQLILKNLQQQVQGPVGDFLKSIDMTSASLDDINKALQIAQDVGTLDNALKGLGNTFANVTNLSVQNKEALVQQFGSVGNLTAALGTYYQNFYTATEQQNAAMTALTATFQQAGLQIPATRDAYRALVEAQDLSTDAGRAAYTVLMQNAGAFASLVPAAADAATAVQTISDTMKGLLADNSKLQVQLLTLQGNTQAANDLQFSIDTAGMTPAEIAQLQANQDLQHSIDLLTAAQQKAQQVAQTGKQLQDQIWQAEGNTTALRQEELAALAKLDPSLVAMQQHLYDLQDQAAATNALLQTVDTSRQALVTSYQQEATALKQTADQATQFAQSLEQFKQSLLVDSSASALNPRGRYAAAKRNFQTIAGEAAAGDVTAEGQLQSAASAFLQASRTMFGSATPYGLDFRAVQNVLTQVEGSAQGQATQATQQLAVVQAQLDKLQSIDTGTKTIAQELASYTAAIIAAINAGLNPDNPLHIGTGAHAAIVQTSATRGQAANDAVVAAVNRVGDRISRLENSNAAGHAIVARATHQGSQEVAKSVAARNWTDRVAKKGALK